MQVKFKSVLAATAFAATIGMVVSIADTAPARASVIDWTIWAAGSAGNPTGLAVGTTTSGIGVTYSGELQSLVANYPSWTPASTFSGGTVGNPPPQSGGILQLFGGTPTIDTITFSSPVTNPVMAIWSLGQSGSAAAFFFNEPFTIQSGGPSLEYNGGPLILLSGGVGGLEGNGTIQFSGTFTQISWNNPQYEDWYGFTVGTAAPESSTWAMMLMGFAAVGFVAYRRTKKRSAAIAST
jgi:hypothetical protein